MKDKTIQEPIIPDTIDLNEDEVVLERITPKKQTFRITLSESEFNEVLQLAGKAQNKELVQKLLHEQKKSIAMRSTKKLTNAAKNATKLREDRCKQRMLLVLLKDYNFKKYGKINYTKFAKAAQTSINTIYKYIDEVKEAIKVKTCGSDKDKKKNQLLVQYDEWRIDLNKWKDIRFKKFIELASHKFLFEDIMVDKEYVEICQKCVAIAMKYSKDLGYKKPQYGLIFDDREIKSNPLFKTN